LITILKLIHSDRNKKIGNHRLEISENGVRRYYYFNTAIVTHFGNIIEIDDGGWKTPSTTRAINSYKKNLSYDMIVDKRG